MFSVLYKGYTIDYNGSATFNVYFDGTPVDSFTNYVDSPGEAFQSITEWIDAFIEERNYDHSELI